MKKAIIAMIHAYQKTSCVYSTLIRLIGLTPPVCRFTPTCSQFMIAAIEKYGVLYGGWMGLKRILRCNPWSPGGIDVLQ